jgi:acetate kinase
MVILVINCGSSSVKYDLFDLDGEVKDLARGVVERIGEETSNLIHETGEGRKVREKKECPDHHKAILMIKEVLVDSRKGVLGNEREVKGVGHRVVHGGEKFNESTVINGDVLESIEKFSELAPLHNPPALAGIRSCREIFSGVPQVAVFDTAFHQSMPDYAYNYAIPREYYEKYGVRKYGFHGTSHRYVSMKAAEELRRPLSELKLITVHLGNGCSVSAVNNGKSVDTSMGFTPLEGLVMGTRCGDIDPAVVTFLMARENYGVDEVNDVLNKKSGLLGVSGISNDMRDILQKRKNGDKRASLAYDMFVFRIKKYIGAYAAVLGKADAVVFTAGIGENVPSIKDTLEKELAALMGEDTRFMVIGTNEELLIAKDTYELIK